MTDPGKAGLAVAKEYAEFLARHKASDRAKLEDIAAEQAARAERAVALHAEARALYDQADNARIISLAAAAQGTADWYTALLKVRTIQEKARVLEAPL